MVEHPRRPEADNLAHEWTRAGVEATAELRAAEIACCLASNAHAKCPCDAIPFGDKIMFNGYEIWKPDVERCTRYRLINPKGSACGRCMKTCPLNKVVDADGALLTRMASWLASMPCG